MKSLLNPLFRARDTEYVLESTRTGEVVADHLLRGLDSAERRHRLLGRESLAESSAIIIAPCSALHTFFMRFAIDIAFAARDGKVIKMRSAVRPWRLAAAQGAFAVVELAAGGLAQSRTESGDVLICRPARPPHDRSTRS